MKHNPELNFSELINLLKSQDNTISLLNEIFPELKYLWLNYKGNKVLPLFSLIETLKADKHIPHISTHVIDTYLIYTGILCVQTEEDLDTLINSNNYHTSLTRVSNILKKKSVSYVRLFTPVSALIILLTGKINNCLKLQTRLNLNKLSLMGTTAILGSINRVIVRDNTITRSNLFKLSGSELTLQVVNKNKERRLSNKKVKDELLSQPIVKKTHTDNLKTTTADTLNLLHKHLVELNNNFNLNKVMIQENTNKIAQLQTAITEQEIDCLKLNELILAMETSIGVIKKSNNIN
jgi:hypothetical protein